MEKMMTLSVPCIHLNGTSADSLCQEIRDAHTAISESIDALSRMTVHRRDHYVKNDPKSYEKARTEHHVRLTTLRKIHDELEEIYLAIRDQV